MGLDPVLRTLAGLEGLDDLAVAVGVGAPDGEAVEGDEFDDGVGLHCGSFLSLEGLSPLCDYNIPHLCRFVNTFFEIF